MRSCRLALVLLFLAAPSFAAVTVTGTLYQSDDATPCAYCYAQAIQVEHFEGASRSYAGNVIETRTASDGTWSLSLLASTNYEFRLKYRSLGLKVDPPEIRTTCASGTCAYTSLTVASGGDDDQLQTTDLVVEDGGTVDQTGTGRFNFDSGFAVEASSATEVDIDLDTTVPRTTGAWTLGGVITFSQLPVVPLVPTLSTHATSKSYVDALDRLQVVNTDGSDATVDGANEITVTGGDGIDTSGASATITIAVDGTVVRDTGNETIAGIKTFSSSPVIPETPTTDTQAASKGYVDDAVAAVTLTEAAIADGALFVRVGDTLTGDVTSTLANGSSALQIAAGAVGTGEIADGEVTSADVATDTLVAGDLATGAVATAEILDDTIAAADIAAGAVGASELASTAVTAGDYTNASITVDADGRITSAASGGASGSSFVTIDAPAGTDPVADSSSDTLNLTTTDGTVVVTGTVGTDTLDFAVDPAALDLADIGGDLENGQLAADAVDAAAIAASAVTTSELATGAVETSDILDGTIAAGDLATGAVTTTGILDSTIASADVAADTLTAADLAAGSVGTSEVADGTLVNADVSASAAIEESKLAFTTNDGSRHDHVAGDVVSGELADARVSNTLTLDNTSVITLPSTASTDPGRIRWSTSVIEVGNGFGVYTFLNDLALANQGATWVGAIAADAVAAAEIATDGVAAAEIAADAVGASEIAADAVGSSEVAADAIGSSELAADSVGSSEVAAGAVGSSELEDVVEAGSCTQCDITWDDDGRVLEAESGGDGSPTAAFVTVDVSGTDAVADAVDDVLAIVGTAPVTVVGTNPDTITVAIGDVALGPGTSGGFATSVSEGGPATTASALVSNGVNCSAGEYPLGVDAAGAAETCTADDDTPDNDSEVPNVLTIASGSSLTLTPTTSPTSSGATMYNATTDRIEVGDGAATDSYPSVNELADASGTLVASLAADSVGAAEVATGAIGAGELAADSVEASEIATGAVTTTELLDGTVALGDLAADSVNASKVVDASIGSAELASLGPGAGSCTACNVTFDDDGRASAFTSGSGGSISTEESNASATSTTTIDFGAGLDRTCGSGECDVTLDYAEDPVDLASSETTGSLAVTRLAEGTAGQFLQMNATPDPAWTTLSGDATISSAGALTIADASVDLASDVHGVLPLAGLTDGATATHPLFAGAAGDPSYRAIATTDLPSGATLDTEWDTFAEINTATTDQDFAGLTGVQTFATGTKTVTAKFDFGGGTLEFPNSVTLPATCTVGEFYFDTNATTGQQLFGCTATDTWTLQGDGNAAAGAGTIIGGDTLSGDVTATMEDDGDTPVQIAAGAVNGGTGGEITDASITEADLAATLAYTGDLDVGGGVFQVPNSTSLPATCDVGDAYMKTDATSGKRLYLCESSNTWVQQTAGSTITVQESESTVSSVVSTLNFENGLDTAENPAGEIDVTLDYTEDPPILATETVGDFVRTITSSGNSALDLFVTGASGESSAPDIYFTRSTNANLANNPSLSALYATFGANGLTFEETQADTVEGALVSADLSTDQAWALPNYSGDLVVTASAQPVDFGGGTLEIPNSDTLPATCTVGQQYMDTNATTGQRLYLCESTDTWALQGDGLGGGVAADSLDFDDFDDTMVVDASTSITVAGSKSLTIEGSGADSPGSLLEIVNTSGASGITTGLYVNTGAGGITTALDVSDADIGTALAIGSNDVTVGGATLSAAEVAALDGGITFAEVAAGTSAVALVVGNSGSLGTSGSGTITATDLGCTGCVSATDLATDSVQAAEIEAGAVGTSEIATDGVEAAEIAAGAVGTSEIATDGVGTDEIAADAVGASEIGPDVVDGTELADTVTLDASLVVKGNTSDASDNLRIDIAPGGAVENRGRGAYLRLDGAENAGGGSASLYSSSTTGAGVAILGETFVSVASDAGGFESTNLSGNETRFFGPADLTLDEINLCFDGTADASETCLAEVNPTADRTINVPDNSGTIAVATLLPNAVTTEGVVDPFSGRQMHVHIMSGASGTTNISQVGTAGYALTANSVVNADAASGPWLGLVTSALSGNVSKCAPTPAFTGDGSFRPDWDPVLRLPFLSGASVASVRYWVGMFSGDPSGSASPAVSLAAFRFDTGAGDTNWQACVDASGGTSPTCVDTGVAAATTTVSDFQLRVNAEGTSYEFWLNGVLETTATSDLPTVSTKHAVQMSATTLTTATKSFGFQRVSIGHE